MPSQYFDANYILTLFAIPMYRIDCILVYLYTVQSKVDPKLVIHKSNQQKIFDQCHQDWGGGHWKD